jgi:hypothetical protein
LGLVALQSSFEGAVEDDMGIEAEGEAFGFSVLIVRHGYALGGIVFQWAWAAMRISVT